MYLNNLYNHSIINTIIFICHCIILLCILLSPFINDIIYKTLVLYFLLFISGHLLSKYGKCGLINIERYFLKDKFKNGIIFKFIKPLICYKRNPFYNHYSIILIYMCILIFQIYNDKHILKNYYNQYSIIIYNLYYGK